MLRSNMLPTWPLPEHEVSSVVNKLPAADVWLQAAEEAASVSGVELQQVAEQLAALDAELTKQGGTQAPASSSCMCD